MFSRRHAPDQLAPLLAEAKHVCNELLAIRQVPVAMQQYLTNRLMQRPITAAKQEKRASSGLAIERLRLLGFPLKRITETRSESVDGTVERIVTTMEVKDVKEGAVAPSNFEIPAGYKKIERQPSSE